MTDTTLKDALHNLSADSGVSDDCCKGIVVGVAAMLKVTGQTFVEAIQTLVAHSPSLRLKRVAPAEWHKEIALQTWLRDTTGVCKSCGDRGKRDAECPTCKGFLFAK